MSELILAEFDETPDSVLELAWPSWVTPSAVDSTLDDAQGWAERVAESAHREIGRMGALQAGLLEMYLRVPAEDETDALGRGEVRVFYDAVIEMAKDTLDLAERVVASGKSSLRSALKDEDEEWLLDVIL